MTIKEPFEKPIAELTGFRYQRLVFPSSLEQLFWAEGEAYRAQRLWFEGLLGITLYVAFLGFEHVLGFSGIGLRLGIVLPIAVAVNMAVLYQFFPGYQELSILLASCLAGSVEIAQLRQGRSAESLLSWLVIDAVLLFVNGVMRLKRRYAVGALLWGAIASLAVLSIHKGEDRRGEYLAVGIVMGCGVLTLIVNYSQDREARIAYLKKAQSAALIKTLADSNEQLAAAAHTDELTGVANRAAFASYVDTLWSDLASSNEACSAVMVDIDHFKQINDRYGHLYGDRVLKRVATLMAEALRRPEDFIARFGGEEFIILLPFTPMNLAYLVAERLRQLVEIAGLPALRAGDPGLEGLGATVSCGVATVSPRMYPDPYSLVAAADEALYEAKRRGRNQVCGMPHAEPLLQSSKIVG